MRPRAASRLRLAGWIGSAVVHVAALATVVVVHARFSFDDPPVAWRGIELDGRFVSPPEPAASAEAISIETAAGPAADANAPPPIRPADSTPLAAADFQERVRAAIAGAESLSFDERLAELRRRTEELNGRSTAESVDRMAAAINGLLGAKPRAEQPAEAPVEGPFDFNTAQLHDVRRETNERGETRYLTVLVDARGRRFETEVDAETGEQLRRVYEIVRGNPLLEQVYRRVVMSLLDRLVAPVGGPAAAPVP